MIKWLKQLFCRHRKTYFVKWMTFFEINKGYIECHCEKCGKTFN